MKVAAFIAGSIIAGFISFLVFSLLSDYQIAQLGYTPEQSDKLIDAFVFVAPLAMLIGGWLTMYCHKKYISNK